MFFDNIEAINITYVPDFNLPWATDPEFNDTSTEGRIAEVRQIHDLLSGFLQNNLVFPEIETGGAKLAITDNANGTLTINAAQTWLWRGLFRFSTDSILAADRLITTAASKTYHVRWHAPGTGIAAPLETYPNGRFDLIDMTAASPSEADASYDTTYDRMLVARIVTNGANAATVTTLINKARIFATASKLLAGYSTSGTSPYPHLTASINWARTPNVRFVAISSQSTNGKDAITWFTGDPESADFYTNVAGVNPAVPSPVNRYEVQASAGGYYNIDIGTPNFTLPAFKIAMEA